MALLKEHGKVFQMFARGIEGFKECETRWNDNAGGGGGRRGGEGGGGGGVGGGGEILG